MQHACTCGPVSWRSSICCSLQAYASSGAGTSVASASASASVVQTTSNTIAALTQVAAAASSSTNLCCLGSAYADVLVALLKANSPQVSLSKRLSDVRCSVKKRNRCCHLDGSPKKLHWRDQLTIRQLEPSPHCMPLPAVHRHSNKRDRRYLQPGPKVFSAWVLLPDRACQHSAKRQLQPHPDLFWT